MSWSPAASTLCRALHPPPPAPTAWPSPPPDTSTHGRRQQLRIGGRGRHREVLGNWGFLQGKLGPGQIQGRSSCLVASNQPVRGRRCAARTARGPTGGTPRPRSDTRRPYPPPCTELHISGIPAKSRLVDSVA
jgi:hypothetical protein